MKIKTFVFFEKETGSLLQLFFVSLLMLRVNKFLQWTVYP